MTKSYAFCAQRNCISAAKENKIIIHLVCGNRKVTITSEHNSKKYYGNLIFLKINEIKDLSDLFLVGIFTYDTICWEKYVII